MTEETLNDYVEKIQAFNMNEDKRFDVVHIKDAVMAGYNICRSECEKGDLENAIRIGALEEENIKLKAQIEKMKCYLPVDERDSDHKWFAYKNLFDTKWKIDYSVQGELPKCNTIKWFENKEAVMFYLVSNGMKYYEEPRR